MPSWPSQAYSKAQQLDPANTSVPPKLALIRQLFSPAGQGAGQSGSRAAHAPARRCRRRLSPELSSRRAAAWLPCGDFRDAGEQALQPCRMTAEHEPAFLKE